MNLARHIRVLIVAVVLAILAVLGPSVAAQVSSSPSPAPTADASPTPSAGPLERQTIVFLTPGLSFEDMMDVPPFESLARAGGAGLVSVRTAPGDLGSGAYLTLGAGARSAGPAFPVIATREHFPCDDDGTLCVDGHPPRGMSIDVAPFEEVNGDVSVPGLLAELVARDVGPTHFLGNGGPRQQDAGFLMAMDPQGNGSGWGDGVFSDPLVIIQSPFSEYESGEGPQRFGGRRSPGLQSSAYLQQFIGQVTADEVQVILLAPTTSKQMDAAGDILPGIIVAEAPPGELFPREGSVGTLTSSTTRRDGLVSNEDVAPTVLQFLGISIPPEMKGSPIEIVDGAPPFSLHARQLAARQRRTPIAIGTGIAIALAGLGVWWCLRRSRQGSTRAVAVGGWLVLSLMTLPMALLAVGTVVDAPMPCLVASIALISFSIPAIAMRVGRRSRFAPPAIVGAAILLFYLVDAAFNSPSQLTTLLGSQGFDGGRYFGMHNVSTGLILGAALFIAGVVRLRWGLLVLIGAMLLIGLPFLGADNGGSVTLAFAGGLWCVLRGTWRRLRWFELLIVVTWTVAGTALVLLADVLGPHTHGERFLEVTGAGGVGAVFNVFVDRLGIGFRLVASSPGGLIFLVLIPILLYVVLRPRPAMEEILAPIPSWRAAITTMLVSSVVAYLANDTGVTAAGLGVVSAIVALVYASLTQERPKAEGPRQHTDGPLPGDAVDRVQDDADAMVPA